VKLIFPKDYNFVSLAVKLVVSTLLVSFYLDTTLHRFIENRLSTKIFFNVRNAVKSDQTLHPRLKIYSFDDSSFATLKAPSLSLKTWVEVLEAIDRRGPEAIYIDQIFAITPESGTDKDELLRRLSNIKTPIVTAAFVTAQSIKGREKLNMERDWYKLRSMFLQDYDMLTSSFPSFANRMGWFAYGPSADLSSSFIMQGHVMNGEGGYVSSALKMSYREAIPHIGLMGKQSLQINNGDLNWDDRLVPTNARGDVLANYLEPRVYYKSSRRMLGLIEASHNGVDLKEINKNDLVLILPAMFTGSVDFTESPVGNLPGGFVIASVLNSRLSDSWFKYHNPMHGLVWVALAATLATIFIPSPLVVPVLCIALLSIGSITVGLFVWFSVVTSLSGSLLSVVMYSMAIIFQKFNLYQRLNKALQYLRDENFLMQSELRQANEISKVFVPVATPNWHGFEIGTYHKPMTMGSGDWYNFEIAKSGKYLHYVLCDISGHGVQAAIIVSTCKTVMSMLSSRTPELLESPLFLETYIKTLNQTLLNQGLGSHTATLVTATFVRDSSEVFIAVCGHPRPIKFQSEMNDHPILVGSPASILGITENLSIKTNVINLDDEDSLVLYTDGVEFPRVLAKILPFYKRYKHVDANTAAKFLVSDVRERKKNFENIQADDVSLVWFRKLKSRSIKAS
jgi:hypothetical protein